MHLLDALQVMDTCGEGYPAKVGSMYIDRWTGTLSSHEDQEIQACISPLPGIGGIVDLSKHPLRHYDVNFMRKEPVVACPRAVCSAAKSSLERKKSKGVWGLLSSFHLFLSIPLQPSLS